MIQLRPYLYDADSNDKDRRGAAVGSFHICAAQVFRKHPSRHRSLELSTAANAINLISTFTFLPDPSLSLHRKGVLLSNLNSLHDPGDSHDYVEKVSMMTVEIVVSFYASMA